jgi:hypothetical protein
MRSFHARSATGSPKRLFLGILQKKWLLSLKRLLTPGLYQLGSSVERTTGIHAPRFVRLWLLSIQNSVFIRTSSQLNKLHFIVSFNKPVLINMSYPHRRRPADDILAHTGSRKIPRCSHIVPRTHPFCIRQYLKKKKKQRNKTHFCINWTILSFEILYLIQEKIYIEGV